MAKSRRQGSQAEAREQQAPKGRAKVHRFPSRGPAYVLFASPADSSYITGEVLTLLGGETTAG